jgi:catechol 2,3-dioxygenase-like lactoylglutathione lyase family enzyme
MKIKNVRHTGIVTDNINSSLKFYKNLLGFKIKKQMLESGKTTDAISNLNNTKVKTIKLTSPDNKSMIELLYFKSHLKKNKRKKYNISEIGISHMAFSVIDLKKTYNKMLKRKINFICPPQISADGNVLLTFCRAPEGTLIELVEELK